MYTLIQLQLVFYEEPQKVYYRDLRTENPPKKKVKVTQYQLWKLKEKKKVGGFTKVI